MSCFCGDTECWKCYPANYYERKREYDDETVDYRTDQILNEMEDSDD